MLTVTQFGNGGVALAIACFLFIFHDHRLAYTLVLGTLTLWLVVELIKAMVHRPRPFIRLETVRIVGSPAVGRSFPSGHTSQAFFMASLFSHHFQMNLGLIVLVYLTAVLVALTRMYVGAHYPRDVLAGAVLGTFWGLMGGIIDTCCGVV
mgnify:CR=1 FL=1